MASEFVRNLLIEQRKRLVGSIMLHAEKNLYPSMSVTQQRAFREKVLASVGAYHDTCLDILKASVNDGSVVNAEALELLRDIHTKVK
jgi:hypothetical protein